MPLSLTIRNRDELIALGKSVGEFIKASHRLTPWTITVEGPLACGKSLIPLAIDRCFRPDRYGETIPEDIKADDLTQPPVVFRNFMGEIWEDNLSLDDRINRVKTSAPLATAYIGSNVITDYCDSRPSCMEAFYKAGLGHQSEFLDMAIEIQWELELKRDVRITMRDLLVEEEFAEILRPRFQL